MRLQKTKHLTANDSTKDNGITEIIEGAEASIPIRKITFKKAGLRVEMDSCAAANYFIFEQTALIRDPVTYQLTVIWKDGKVHKTNYLMTKIEGLKYLPLESFLAQENILLSLPCTYAGVSGPYSAALRKHNNRLDIIQSTQRKRELLKHTATLELVTR